MRLDREADYAAIIGRSKLEDHEEEELLGGYHKQEEELFGGYHEEEDLHLVVIMKRRTYTWWLS